MERKTEQMNAIVKPCGFRSCKKMSCPEDEVQVVVKIEVDVAEDPDPPGWTRDRWSGQWIVLSENMYCPGVGVVVFLYQFLG